MSLKNHFKFNVGEAKQLGIALISSYGMWAATGFQKTVTGLMYPLMGFITGGLASHNSTASPNVMPQSHIETPYVNNIDDKSNQVPPPIQPTLIPVAGEIKASEPQQQFQNVKIIPRNDQNNIS
jgi:hypothetical protein